MVFSPSGQLVTEWGSYGGGDIQFGAPGGISEGMNGDVYVLDHRQVSVFRVDLGAQ